MKKLAYIMLVWYSKLTICYEKYILNRLKRIYDKMHKNTIKEIVEYDFSQMSKRVLYSQPKLMVLYNFIMYFLRMPHKGYKNPTYFHPSRFLLHEIVCWDNKKYLTYTSFDTLSRGVRPRKHKYLYGSISDKIDLTNFINQHIESFNSTTCLTLEDILYVLAIEKQISFKEFCAFMLDQTKTLYVIDDTTLEVRRFKDYELIVL